MKSNIILAAIIFCAALLTCNMGGHTVTYEVTGDAIDVSVLFCNEYGDDEGFSKIRLPWVKTFDIQFRDDTYYGGKFVGDLYPAHVSATLVDRRGHISAVIYIDGVAVDTGMTSAYSYTATARYAVRLR